jgi:hypothetical protein
LFSRGEIPTGTNSGTRYADRDLNGTVRGAGLNRALGNHKQTGIPWSPGDFDRSGMIDGVDLITVLSNHNQSAGATAAIPEPSTLALLGSGAIGLLAYACREVGSDADR